MKCVTTLRQLVTSEQFSYLHDYPLHGDFAWEFSSRTLCNSAIRSLKKSGIKLHCCYNPARSSFCPVRDVDYKRFKSCSSFVKKYFSYFERIGIL